MGGDPHRCLESALTGPRIYPKLPRPKRRHLRVFLMSKEPFNTVVLLVWRLLHALVATIPQPVIAGGLEGTPLTRLGLKSSGMRGNRLNARGPCRPPFDPCSRAAEANLKLQKHVSIDTEETKPIRRTGPPGTGPQLQSQSPRTQPEQIRWSARQSSLGWRRSP